MRFETKKCKNRSEKARGSSRLSLTDKTDMDKNTIYGLILMAAIFFAFVWFSPKPEANTDAEAKTEQIVDNAATGVDSLTATEREWLVPLLPPARHIFHRSRHT